VAAVKEGMTRCSQFVHEEPRGAITSLPGRTDLAVWRFERGWAQPGRQARGAISSSAALGPQVPAA
jgi:hypothetical protein